MFDELFQLNFYAISFGNFRADCLWRTEESCVWGLLGWPSRWWRSCLQEDPFESWRCSGKKCPYKFLGMKHLREADLSGVLFLFYMIVMSFCMALFTLSWTCRVWTLLPISWDHLSGNGNLWLRPTLMSRLLTISPWGCSALLSPRSVQTSRSGHAMHSQARFA